MGANSEIVWTDHTFNPWWGCTKVALECDGCYAEGFDRRVGGAHWGKGVPRRFFGDKHWREPEKWDRESADAGVRRKVFCASMADVFDPEVDESWRMRLWGLIERTPHLDWLLLTKRPDFALMCVPGAAHLIRDRVWVGTSIGHPDSLWRLDALRDLAVAWDAAVTFVSAEPLIAPWTADLTDIDWLIVGGESGPKARPMDPLWAYNLMRAARESRTAFFMKQMGGRVNKRGDVSDLPAEIRFREWPALPRTPAGRAPCNPGERDGAEGSGPSAPAKKSEASGDRS